MNRSKTIQKPLEAARASAIRLHDPLPDIRADNLDNAIIALDDDPKRLSTAASQAVSGERSDAEAIKTEIGELADRLKVTLPDEKLPCGTSTMALDLSLVSDFCSLMGASARWEEKHHRAICTDGWTQLRPSTPREN